MDKLSKQQIDELACVYSALILYDSQKTIDAEGLTKLTKTAGIELEPFWPGLFAKFFQGKNISELIQNVGSAPAPQAAAVGGGQQGAAETAKEEKKEEKVEEEEEEDDDLMGGLF